MKLPQHSGTPPYQVVADAIRAMIRSGQLGPGAKVPSSRELEAKYKIANMTARSSLRLLREEGLIYSVPGRGSFVAEPPPPKLPSEYYEDRGPVSSAEFRDLSARVDELAQRIDRITSIVEQVIEQRGGQDRT